MITSYRHLSQWTCFQLEHEMIINNDNHEGHLDY